LQSARPSKHGCQDTRSEPPRATWNDAHRVGSPGSDEKPRSSPPSRDASRRASSDASNPPSRPASTPASRPASIPPSGALEDAHATSQKANRVKSDRIRGVPVSIVQIFRSPAPSAASSLIPRPCTTGGERLVLSSYPTSHIPSSSSTKTHRHPPREVARDGPLRGRIGASHELFPLFPNRDAVLRVASRTCARTCAGG